MFKLTKPCNNCPFRKGQGERFMLGTDRVLKILNGSAFQCHKTIDYDNFEDPFGRQGDNPQQCVGVMSLLHRAGLPNQIMQVAERLREVPRDYFTKLDHLAVYDNIADALEAHSWGEDWAQQVADYEPQRGPQDAPQVIAGEPTRARMPRFLRAWERFERGESRYN